jgi:hypothetical protein
MTNGQERKKDKKSDRKKESCVTIFNKERQKSDRKKESCLALPFLAMCRMKLSI